MALQSFTMECMLDELWGCLLCCVVEQKRAVAGAHSVKGLGLWVGRGSGHTKSRALCVWERGLWSAPRAEVTITGPCLTTFTGQPWTLKMSLKGEHSPQRSFLACWRIKLEGEFGALKGHLWPAGGLKGEQSL